MNRFGIRQQVALLTLAPLLLISISLGYFFLTSRFQDIDENLLERGKLIARQLASSSEYGVFSNNQVFLQNIADGVLQEQDVSGVIVLNSASEILIEAGGFSAPLRGAVEDANFAVAGYPSGQSQISSAGEIKEAVNLLTPIRSNKNSFWIYQPIIPAQVEFDEFESGQVVGQVGAVIVEMTKVNASATKSHMLWLTIIVAGIFLAMSLFLVFLASRSITYPIRRLSDAVKAIGIGDLDTRVSLTTRVKELATLAEGLNDTAAQLQQERSILQQRIEEATRELRDRKEEAEQANHEKSRFLAVASHDLRQPLHALGLYVAELQRKITSDEQRHLLVQVESSVEALSALMNALLDISKLDAGVVVPQQQTCSVKGIVEHVIADYRMLASIKNIQLAVRSCSWHVTSDPLLLERILTNLVSNAIRYTHPNGRVLVACRRRGRFLRIEIRDNGPGIPKLDQSNIFREFFQLNHPTLTDEKGLGLGLSIVERLVKLLDHRIELRSAPGKGSVFSLELPMATPVTNQDLTDDPDSNGDDGAGNDHLVLTSKRLLVVDDDEMVLSSTSGILTAWGGKVSTAASLEQVERLLQSGEKWDLIISDYQLEGGTNGIDVVTMVRQNLDVNIPCILISGDTSPTILKLASVGGYRLLHKPVRPAKLRSLVEYLLNVG